MAVEDYNPARLHGIVKIASKMGVSTIQSYESAQIFEIVGIRKDVVDQYFTNTVSRVGGVGLEEIAEGTEYYHSRAFDPLGLQTDGALDSSGYHRLRCGPDGFTARMYAMVIKVVRPAISSVLTSVLFSLSLKIFSNIFCLLKILSLRRFKIKNT